MYAVCVPVGSSGTDLLTATATDEDVQAKHRQQKWTLAGGGPFSVDENGVITAGDVSSYGDKGYFPLELMVSGKAVLNMSRDMLFPTRWHFSRQLIAQDKLFHRQNSVWNFLIPST